MALTAVDDGFNQSVSLHLDCLSDSCNRSLPPAPFPVRHTKGFVIRIFLFSALLIYLGADLYVFNGPLRKRIQRGLPDSPESIAAAKSQGVVARVLHLPILASQLERATKERLWLRGKKLDDLTPQQRRIERLAALDDLIDHQLLRIKTKHNATELPVAEAEVDEALKRLAARFHRLWKALHPPDRTAARKLLSACRRNDAPAASAAWTAWRDTRPAGYQPPPDLQLAVLAMQRHLFGPAPVSAWQGDDLDLAFRRQLATCQSPAAAEVSPLPPLNPQT